LIKKIKAFFFKISNKLRGVFMPDNNNLQADDVRNVLVDAETFVKRWFNDTVSLFESNVKSDKPVEHLCITSLTVSVTYVRAIIILLSNGVRMPAKALLRILFELATRLAWCLLLPDESLNPDELIEEKIRRWSRSSVKERIRILNAFEKFWPQDAIHELNTRRESFEKLLKSLEDVKELPPFAQLVGQLPGAWGLELYARCYSKFNDAVHLDISSLGDRVKEDGRKLYVEFDSKELIEDLIRYCVVMERMIFFLVRTHYEWDTKQLMKTKI